MTELDMRLLRSFVAVAEELHFTRAAARLHVAQQALSRDVRRLEDQLALRLFDRTSRRVALTGDGERLLAGARDLLARHDDLLADLRDDERELLVDVLAPGTTGARVLARAQQRPGGERLVARYGGGLAAALPLLLSGGLDAAVGRVEGLGVPFPNHRLSRIQVRQEPLALLVPSRSALAAEPGPLPCVALRGLTVDVSAGNEAAAEWVDAGHQLLRAFGGTASPRHAHVVGAAETARHLRIQGVPILTVVDAPPVDDSVLRPLVDPVPCYPVSLVLGPGARRRGGGALLAAAADLARREGWLRPPRPAWFPVPVSSARESGGPRGR